MWDPDQLKWLLKAYPGLKQVDNSIEGRLSFQMLSSQGKYYINPSPERISDLKAGDHYICDTYKIRITWEIGFFYPTIVETGGRLQNVAKRYGLNIIDLHVYPFTHDLCLASTMELERTFKNGFKLDVYTEELVIPYLFAQSYFAKNKEWLWGELSHDFVGALEWLGRQQNSDDRDVISTYNTLMKLSNREKVKKLILSGYRGHAPCICESMKKTRKCHPEFLFAVSKLQKANKNGLILIK